MMKQLLHPFPPLHKGTEEKARSQSGGPAPVPPLTVVGGPLGKCLVKALDRLQQRDAAAVAAAAAVQRSKEDMIHRKKRKRQKRRRRRQTRRRRTSYRSSSSSSSSSNDYDDDDDFDEKSKNASKKTKPLVFHHSTLNQSMKEAFGKAWNDQLRKGLCSSSTTNLTETSRTTTTAASQNNNTLNNDKETNSHGANTGAATKQANQTNRKKPATISVSPPACVLRGKVHHFNRLGDKWVITLNKNCQLTSTSTNSKREHVEEKNDSEDVTATTETTDMPVQQNDSQDCLVDQEEEEYNDFNPKRHHYEKETELLNLQQPVQLLLYGDLT